MEFWKAVSIDPELEDEYLQRHTLTDGCIDFLKEVQDRVHQVWCLSNDLSEWSKKLRLRFGLDKYFTGFIISGDVGIRKPDPEIFNQLIERLHITPTHTIFVDDNQNNLNSAAVLGFKTVLFRPTNIHILNKTQKAATTFREILVLLS